MDRRLRVSRWSSILLTTISQLKAEGLEGEKLVRQLYIPAKAGRYEDEGFKHHPELGISVQGQSAADAWKEIERIARHWSISVSVSFEWRETTRRSFQARQGSYALAAHELSDAAGVRPAAVLRSSQ